MGNLSSTVNRIGSAISGLSNAFLGQTRWKARLNAIASYDQSNELFKVCLFLALLSSNSDPCFQAFLSKEMMYSCGLWSDSEGGVRGDLETGPTPGDLEAAQLRKIRHVLTAAKVKPGDRILEFGSGWGGLAIEVRQFRGNLLVQFWLILGQSGCHYIRMRSRYLDTIQGTKGTRRRAHQSSRSSGSYPRPSYGLPRYSILLRKGI